MRISIGSDHGGFLLKEEVVKYLKEKGIEVLDRGTNSLDSVHYPVYAKLVCDDFKDGKCDFAILICTTGLGMCMCANKYKSVRASCVRSVDEAMLTRSHNDCNVLCLGAKYTKVEDAKQIIDTFLTTPFAGGRHEIRVNMIKDLEEK